MTWLRDKAARLIGLMGLLLLFFALGHIEIADALFEKNNEVKKR